MSSTTGQALHVKHYRSSTTCQALQVKHYMSSTTGQALQVKHYRSSTTGQALQVKHYRSSTTGQALQVKHYRSSTTGQALQVKHYRSSTTGQALQVKHYRSSTTGQACSSTESLGETREAESHTAKGTAQTTANKMKELHCSNHRSARETETNFSKWIPRGSKKKDSAWGVYDTRPRDQNITQKKGHTQKWLRTGNRRAQTESLRRGRADEIENTILHRQLKTNKARVQRRGRQLSHMLAACGSYERHEGYSMSNELKISQIFVKFWGMLELAKTQFFSCSLLMRYVLMNFGLIWTN